MVPDKGVPAPYLIGWARQNMDAIVGRANGTTFLEISKANFRPMPALRPPHYILERYAAASNLLYERMTANVAQNETLAELRDLLLPRLLSGELRVAEAEALVP